MRNFIGFFGLLAFTVFALVALPNQAQAAPKYITTLTDNGIDAGATNTYRATNTENTYLLTCTQPYCYKTAYTTSGRVLPACATDFVPEVTVTTFSTDDAGLRTTITTAIPYEKIPLGPDNSIAAKALDAGAMNCKLYYLPPIANGLQQQP